MHLIRFEHSRQPLASRPAFLRRLATNVAVALGLIAVSLLAGMAGYHFLGGLAWLDAFLNAAMILSGMGPVDIHQRRGEVFCRRLRSLFRAAGCGDLGAHPGAGPPPRPARAARCRRGRRKARGEEQAP
jgi:hypothetical protein